MTVSVRRTSAAAVMLAATTLALPPNAGATWEGIPSYLEYSKRVESAQKLGTLDAGAFGETVSLYNGATEFSVTDIELPGNSALRVHLTRRHPVKSQPQGMYAYDTRFKGLSNWDIELPHVSATYPTKSPWKDNRCSTSDPKPYVPGAFLLSEIWHGISVYLPGRGSSPLMTVGPNTPVPTVGGPYRYTTSERDVIDCIPMKSGLTGEGFRLTTAQGVKYLFNVAVMRTASLIERQIYGPDSTYHYRIPRTMTYLLPSRVEDRHGNYVDYWYSAEGYPLQITANDGRSIIFRYSAGRLTSATANNTTWYYDHDGTWDQLKAVRRPDGSSWQYAYVGGMDPMVGGFDSLPPMPYCHDRSVAGDADYELHATHPSGLVGKFIFKNIRHWRSGVHANECYAFNLNSGAEPDYTLANSHFFDIPSLLAKELTGTGIATPMRWDYDYYASPDYMEDLWGKYGGSEAYPCTTCTPHKTVVVRNPDGTQQRHTFGKLYLVNEGRPLRVETLNAAGAVVRDQKTQYLPDALASTQLFHPNYGGVLGGLGDRTHTHIRPVVERTTVQDGTTFYWRVKSTCGSGQTYCFDSFARPTVVDKGSAPGP